VWWLGDMGGNLVVAPFVLLFVGHLREAPRERWLEAVVLLALLTTVALVLFREDKPLAYVAFPFLIWAGLRFGPHGASAASLLVAGTAVAYTANRYGAFVEGTRDESLLLAQTFSEVAAVTALLLAAVAAERRQVEAASAQARSQEALEINDNIVQGLAVAHYAVQAGRTELAADALETTLTDARAIIGDLLDRLPPDAVARPGALRRRSPAEPARSDRPSSLPPGGG
jgi:signal transduction histidine kinase